MTGQAEIIALSHIYSVNCVVWEVNGGYAQYSLCHITSPNNRTVHLHMSGRQHYEITDIPEVHYFSNDLFISSFIEIHFSGFFTCYHTTS